MPRVVSFIVLVGILLFIATMFFKVMAQFVLPLFLAAVLVVIFKPLHMRTRDLLPGRLRISALVTTVLIMLVVLLPTGFLGWNAYLEGRDVVKYLANKENRDQLLSKIEREVLPAVNFYEELSGRRTPTDSQPNADDSDHGEENIPAEGAVLVNPTAPLTATALYDRGAATVGGFLVDFAKGLLRLIIGLIIMVLALYYFLVDGPGMIHTMMRLSPLDNEYERELLDRFVNVSRAVVVAVLAAAVVQGLLAGIGFYFALAPGAPVFLLTMLTMTLAVVPFVGAAGVWIPTCLWIFFYQGQRIVDGQTVEGEPFTALVLAAYCLGVVSTIDNVIKPYVLHGQSNLHPLLALMSVLGGVTALGPVGILVGPMLVAFIHALLVMVNKELRLLSSGEPRDGLYQKSMFPVSAEQQREAEGMAGRTAGEELEHLALEAAGAGGSGRGKRPGAIARVRDAAKRRRKRK
ncbi:MAG: AI-2E family transporter [Pirellulales bacterium]|nr:AI-2E family transporter [Pirellulales bacterium]